MDDTLPGAALRIVGQNLALRDSLFSGLASGAAGSLVVQNSSLVVSNSTFLGNSQAGGGALFLNGSRATVYNSVFERNRGALGCSFIRVTVVAGANWRQPLQTASERAFMCAACGLAIPCMHRPHVRYARQLITYPSEQQSHVCLHACRHNVCPINTEPDLARMCMHVRAGYQAGAIVAVGGSSLLVNLTVFRANAGAQGGGVGLSGAGGQLQVVDSVFVRNSAQNGAGIFVQQCAAPPLQCSSFYSRGFVRVASLGCAFSHAALCQPCASGGSSRRLRIAARHCSPRHVFPTHACLQTSI